MEGRGFGIHFLPAQEWGEFMIESEKQLGVVMREAGITQ
jgi:hypothetical protein